MTVTGTADAEVVEQVPGLAEDLRFEDAVAAGWTVEGPTATDTGGLTITLRHAVSSADEATNLLASLGPPFVDVRLTRTIDGDDTTTELTGQLVLENGFDSFADSDLLARPAAHRSPPIWPPRLPRSRCRCSCARLPGDIEETTGTEVDGVLEWSAQLDGSTLDLTTRTVQKPGPTWASVVLGHRARVARRVGPARGAFLVSVVRVRRRRAKLAWPERGERAATGGGSANGARRRRAGRRRAVRGAAARQRS